MSNQIKCSHILVKKQSEALQIMERIKNITSQANLDQLASQNKKYLIELKKQNSKKYDEIVMAFKNRNQQLLGG